MSDDMTSQAQKKANLARIRDNQRRSRARRKDYLNELESKYRSCEQAGVSASSEIQAAARRVIEENKRLRQMLKARGVTDAEIDGSSKENPQFSNSANFLEEMVDVSKPCRPGCEDSSADSARSSRSTSGPPPQPVMPAAKTEVQTPPPVQDVPQMSQPGIDYRQHTTAAPEAEYPAQPNQPPVQYGFDTGISGPPQLFQNEFSADYAMPYDSQLGWLDQYPTQDLTSVSSQPDMRFSETSSCQVAAGTIRTFKPEAGYELEQELGCKGAGQDCEVLNTHIFRVMDRYTDSAV